MTPWIQPITSQLMTNRQSTSPSSTLKIRSIVTCLQSYNGKIKPNSRNLRTSTLNWSLRSNNATKNHLRNRALTYKRLNNSTNVIYKSKIRDTMMRLANNKRNKENCLTSCQMSKRRKMPPTKEILAIGSLPTLLKGSKRMPSSKESWKNSWINFQSKSAINTIWIEVMSICWLLKRNNLVNSCKRPWHTALTLSKSTRTNWTSWPMICISKLWVSREKLRANDKSTMPKWLTSTVKSKKAIARYLSFNLKFWLATKKIDACKI